jgi:hypothetical protein
MQGNILADGIMKEIGNGTNYAEDLKSDHIIFCMSTVAVHLKLA